MSFPPQGAVCEEPRTGGKRCCPLLGMWGLRGASWGSRVLCGASWGLWVLRGASQGMRELSGASRGMRELSGASLGLWVLCGASCGRSGLHGASRGTWGLHGASQGMQELNGAPPGLWGLHGASRCHGYQCCTGTKGHREHTTSPPCHREAAPALPLENLQTHRPLLPRQALAAPAPPGERSRPAARPPHQTHGLGLFDYF